MLQKWENTSSTPSGKVPKKNDAAFKYDLIFTKNELQEGC
jgi:hypothetical protein